MYDLEFSMEYLWGLEEIEELPGIYEAACAVEHVLRQNPYYYPQVAPGIWLAITRPRGDVPGLRFEFHIDEVERLVIIDRVGLR